MVQNAIIESAKEIKNEISKAIPTKKKNTSKFNGFHCKKIGG